VKRKVLNSVEVDIESRVFTRFSFLKTIYKMGQFHPGKFSINVSCSCGMDFASY